ncbi:MAG: hypothetical protein ACXWX4_01070 [Actinomycetota bacterium]
MAASGRSPLRAYLAMAGVALAVFVGLNLIAEPSGRQTRPEPDTSTPLNTDAPAPSLERDFLTTVLGRPRVSDTHPYCDGRGCCPTWRTTFGTTAPTKDVIAAFEVQGYFAPTGDRETVRGGPFPAVRWTGELDYAGRWEWRRVVVARGPDVDRPDWPTVFVESSIACNGD